MNPNAEEALVLVVCDCSTSIALAGPLLVVVVVASLEDDDDCRNEKPLLGGGAA